VSWLSNVEIRLAGEKYGKKITTPGFRSIDFCVRQRGGETTAIIQQLLSSQYHSGISNSACLG
jgi:hypothetical protein